jgi:hypothetical protein
VIPPAFQTQRALKILNVGAVGLALAGVVAAVLANAFPEPGRFGLASGIPTLLVGTFWAWVLRNPGTVGRKRKLRWGWVLSVPLAMLNASIACGVLMSFQGGQWDEGRFLIGAVMGVTLGAVVWLPALIATLACFGLPIAWAQQLAKKGLAGEERGEWIVGLVCVVMSIFGLCVSLAGPDPDSAGDLAGAWMTRGFSLLGALAGATSTGLALAREGRRRRFVADAGAGKIAGYRVDPTEEGRVLVRVVAQGKGYRVADFEEEVFELDADGEAMREKRVAGAAR